MIDKQRELREKVANLQRTFLSIFELITTIIEYHKRRTYFFRRWNFGLQIFGAFFALIGLPVIFYNSVEKSLPVLVAIVAIFLLFLSMLLDLSKKAETHRWITAACFNLNKEIAACNLITWNCLDDAGYEGCKKIYNNLLERIDNLRKEQEPTLDFLLLISSIQGNPNKSYSIILAKKVKWWHNFLADYFAMPHQTLKIRNIQEKTDMEQEEQQQPPPTGTEH